MLSSGDQTSHASYEKRNRKEMLVVSWSLTSDFTYSGWRRCPLNGMRGGGAPDLHALTSLRSPKYAKLRTQHPITRNTSQSPWNGAELASSHMRIILD